MITSSPVPFRQAAELMRAKGVMPTSMSARELEQLPAEIHERAFTSARVLNKDFLTLAKQKIDAIVSPEGRPAGEYMDNARFREEMRDYLARIGYAPEQGTGGGIQDLSSDDRLNLIADMNVQSAQGYGQQRQAQDPAVLDAFPAQELFRLEFRDEPRDWVSVWTGRVPAESGKTVRGTIHMGRLLALKNDPIWTDISRFGRPYPPYDYNSGMWVKPVSRKDAVAAGLIGQKESIPPRVEPLNQDLQSGVKATPPELRQPLVDSFEGRAKIVDGVLRLIPAKEALQDLLSRRSGAVNIGPVSLAAAETAAAKGIDIKDHQLLVSADQVTANIKKHGETIDESDIANLPDTQIDPRVESTPDGDLVFWVGALRTVYEIDKARKRLKLKSILRSAT